MIKKTAILGVVFLLCAGRMALGQATLPTGYSGPWKVGPLPTGWTQTGLGTDYASDYDGSGGTAAKFDGSGDLIEINFSGVPNTVSYYIIGNSFGGASTFKVQESTAGSTWTDVATYNSGNPAPGTATKYEHNLLSASRYVKFLYVTKATGNVGIDGVTIAKTGVSFIPTGSQSVPVSYTLTLAVSITPTGSGMQSWSLLPAYSGAASLTNGSFNFTPAVADNGGFFTLKVVATNPASTGTVAITVTPYVPPSPYTCTFEDGTKSSYVSGNVTLSNRVWSLAGILIGSTSQFDRVIGAKSARLQYGYYDGNEAMTVQSPLLGNGMGTISLWYGPFSDHGTNAPTLAIEISESLTAGWLEVGEVNAGSVTNLTYYSADVYVSTPIFVRIRGKSGETGKSANFDNLTITPYSAPVVVPYDAFLLQYNVTPGDPGTAAGDDLDGDGFSNTNEFSVGTNPYDEAIHP